TELCDKVSRLRTESESAYSLTSRPLKRIYPKPAMPLRSKTAQRLPHSSKSDMTSKRRPLRGPVRSMRRVLPIGDRYAARTFPPREGVPRSEKIHDLSVGRFLYDLTYLDMLLSRLATYHKQHRHQIKTRSYQ